MRPVVHKFTHDTLFSFVPFSILKTDLDNVKIIGNLFGSLIRRTTWANALNVPQPSLTPNTHADTLVETIQVIEFIWAWLFCIEHFSGAMATWALCDSFDGNKLDAVIKESAIKLKVTKENENKKHCLDVWNANEMRSVTRKNVNGNRETTKWNGIDFLWCRLMYQQYLFILIDSFCLALARISTGVTSRWSGWQTKSSILWPMVRCSRQRLDENNNE